MSTYGTIYALGTLACVAITCHRAAKHGCPTTVAWKLVVRFVAAAVLGAQLAGALTNVVIAGKWIWPALAAGTGASWGAIVGATLYVTVSRRIWFSPHGRTILAAALPTVPAMQALGRLGCAAAGCCHGRPTDLPWSIIADSGIPVHPVQYYESLLCAGLAFAVWRSAQRHGPRAIELTLRLYLTGYSTIRLFTEQFRGDDERGFIGPFSLATLVSSSWLLAVAISSISGRRRSRDFVRYTLPNDSPMLTRCPAVRQKSSESSGTIPPSADTRSRVIGRDACSLLLLVAVLLDNPAVAQGGVVAPSIRTDASPQPSALQASATEDASDELSISVCCRDRETGGIVTPLEFVLEERLTSRDIEFYLPAPLRLPQRAVIAVATDERHRVRMRRARTHPAELTIVSPRHLPRVLRIAAGSDRVSVTEVVWLTPGKQLTGTVRDGNEQPMADVMIGMRANGPYEFGVAWNALSDGAGNYRLPAAVPPGRHRLTSLGGNFTFVTSRDVEVRPSVKHVVHDIVARRTAVVAGTVVDSAGKPVAGAIIEATDKETDQSLMSIVDQLGRFRLRANSDSLGDLRDVRLTAAGGGATEQLADRLSERSSALVCRELSAARLLALDPNGAALVKYLVCPIKPEQGQDILALNFLGADHPNGTIDLGVRLREASRLRVMPFDDTLEPQVVEVHVDQLDPPVTQVRLARRREAGLTIQDASGEPVPNLLVTVAESDRSTYGLEEQVSTAARFTGSRGELAVIAQRRTDAAGTVRLPMPEHGLHFLYVRLGEASRPFHQERFPRGQMPGLLRVPATTTVRGQVVGRLPAECLSVRVSLDAARHLDRRRVTLDADGRFECSSLTAGEWHLEVGVDFANLNDEALLSSTSVAVATTTFRVGADQREVIDLRIPTGDWHIELVHFRVMAKGRPIESGTITLEGNRAGATWVHHAIPVRNRAEASAYVLLPGSFTARLSSDTFGEGATEQFELRTRAKEPVVLDF